MSEQLNDEKLEQRLLRGLRPGRVTLADPDPGWPERFEERAAELRAALGERVRSLDHVGSTSVPGLSAKPIIDIALGVDDPDDEDAFLPELLVLGYDLRVREPGHRCLRLGEPGDEVNLHCYPPDGVEIRRYLAFRDRLRASTPDRELYEATKRELAQRDWRDVNYHAEAKRPVIFQILGRAGWVED